jgi:hypothetical protein
MRTSCWLWLLPGALGACANNVPGPNRAPVAVAGPDQVGAPGVEVLLDGSGSYDPDGDPITHQWMLLSAPAGSGLAALEQVAARQALLVFTPDAAGTYVLGLTVSDGRLSSARDVAQVRAGGERCEGDEDCPEDENPCTARRCQAGQCVQAPVTDGTPCDDGRYCTTGDVCQGGVCQAGPARECGDGNACTRDLCDEALGRCENPPAEDGAECGQRSCQGLVYSRQVCQAGVCSGVEVLEECDDSNECTSDQCSASSGCSHAPVEDGTRCTSDQLFCTGIEECRQGACTSPGNPCPNPAECDEERDACGACGDGAVDAAAGEQCDPGLPQGDHCCDPGTCRWVGAGGLDPQGHCGGAPACQRDVCDGAGGCSLAMVGAGTPCGDTSDTACTDPDTCDGLGVCQPRHAGPETVCREAAGACDLAERCTGSSAACPEDAFRPGTHVCREAAGACDLEESCTGNSAQCPEDAFRPGTHVCRAADGACDLVASCTGTSASCPANEFRPSTFECRQAVGACDLAASCTGSSADCPANAFRPSSDVCRVGVGECDIPEQCPGDGVDCPPNVFYPSETPCGSNDENECTKPDTCDALGDCLPNHTPDGAACTPGSGRDPCSASCVQGECQDGLPAADLTICRLEGVGAGICCSAVCRGGGECCAAPDCDDGNACTLDGCTAYQCTSLCTDLGCMILTAQSPVQPGGNAGLTLEMCPASRDVADLVCQSSRNVAHLFLRQDFEIDLSGFITNGNASRVETAMGWVARLCQDGATLQLRLDTRGFQDIAVSFTAVDFGTEDGEIMELAYSPNGGSNWKSVALVGDEAGSPLRGLRTFHVVLPPEVDDNQDLYLEWYLRNGNSADDCVLVDDVTVYAMLPMTSIATLVDEDFEGGDFGFFNQFDPNPEDVYLLSHGGSTRVRVDDNAGANLYSNSIDASGVLPYDLLVLSWDWIGVNISNNDRYIVVQYSTDGLVWSQLAATGHVDAPAVYTRYRVVLPCEAHDATSLRVRFLASLFADNGENDGVNIDNVRLDVLRPAYVDSFQEFIDQTGGIYQGAMTAGATPGTAQVICRHQCDQWSNQDGVSVLP